MFKRRLITFATIFINTIVYANQINPDELNKLLSDRIGSEEPGCIVAVVSENDISYYSRGKASLEHSISLSKTSRMLTASTSKQFLGYAILKLVDEKKLRLDDELHNYLPEFENFKGVKVYQLLNHTAGVRSHWAMFELQGKSLFDEYKASLVKETLTKSLPDFEPNSRYLYSNGGYFILTQIIEKVSKQSFAEYMEANVFKPLGMNNTSYLAPYNKVINNRADGYFKNDDGSFSTLRTHSEIVGPGHIVTTIEDFALWGKYLVSIDLDKLLHPLASLQTSTHGDKVEYFGGLIKEYYNGEKVFHHAGYYENWRQGFNLYPDKKLALISLCNRADLSTNQLNYDVAKHVLAWLSDVFTSVPDEIQHKAEGIYFSKELNDLIDIRTHKGNLYYLSPANSSFAKLDYDAGSKQIKGIGFKQNTHFDFQTSYVRFNSPLLSGKFYRLQLEEVNHLEQQVLGSYISDDGFGSAHITANKTGISLKLEAVGSFHFIKTTSGVWVDRDNLSTITFIASDNKLSFSLSAKHIKNLKYSKPRQDK